MRQQAAAEREYAQAVHELEEAEHQYAQALLEQVQAEHRYVQALREQAVAELRYAEAIAEYEAALKRQIEAERKAAQLEAQETQRSQTALRPADRATLEKHRD